MRIREVWIRFYKSFNYDYELKANPGATRLEWQETPEGWMPHVRIPLEADITAIVGSNESGKTHLLDAIEIVLSGESLRKRDFCRYSSLFSVERDSRMFPEVGATLTPNEWDLGTLATLGLPTRENGDILMLRPEPGVIHLVNAENERVELTEAQIVGLQALLPHPSKLKTTVALPDSVPIATLAGSVTIAGRRQRFELLKFLAPIKSADDISGKAANLLALLSTAQPPESAAQALGRLLLTKVACIEESSFQELQAAISEEREGLVNGLIQEMNNSIARHLNISRWWSQDPEFQLRVSPREHELVFTIRDRTGTDYSFTERSRGLTYFLSYYVQLLSHDRPVDRAEILLMDEPDAYLSASGQQDLLRVLEHHAHPEISDRTDQVVYVTHSPFLINRNAGHRVRVVDKGSRDEGTRLVRDATRNHYEPLRTSLGAFVAETAFIGGDNLFVEGIADQVLLVGMNSRLLRAGAPPSKCLDLNQVTIVPGGASLPYMLYLARGRDKVKPACAVLLDSDTAGLTARKQIQRGGARGKRTLADDLIVMVGEWASTVNPRVHDGVVVREPEDLIPVNVALAAARRYAQSLLGVNESDTKQLTEVAITDGLPSTDGSLWDALEVAFAKAFDTDITKAGFAKELIGYLADTEGSGSRPAGVPALDENFASLISSLADILRLASERERDSRRDQRLERIIESFTADHPDGSKRDRAATTLNRIDAAVDNTTAGDIIRAGTSKLRRDFKLSVDPLTNVDDYSTFLERLKNLRHLERLTNQGAITS